MHASIILASTMGAAVMAAPVYPSLNLAAAMPGDIDSVSEYFNMLAQKTQESRAMAMAPVCDMSKAVLPLDNTNPNVLPPPTAGLTLKHVAIGRGTQNYTCDLKNDTAVPVATGAVATLFNASCIASTYPDLFNMLPKVALKFNLSDAENPKMAPATNMAISGKHFFVDNTTPFFNLDTPALKLGEAPCGKNNTQAAPPDAPKGQAGEVAVAWLKLLTKNGATGDLQEVYRVHTAGGSPPPNCKNQKAHIEVQYSAEYWFYEGKPAANPAP